MQKLITYLLKKIFWGFLQYVVSDRWYAKIRYRIVFNRRLNLRNPQAFTEKIQYIKLNEHRQLRKIMADRTQARKYVAQKIGEKFLIPLHGIYKTLDRRDWDGLPRQFVLKANHGCGMLEIVRNKEERNYDAIRKKTESWKKKDYYKEGREWAYKGLPRTILAEQLLLDADDTIPSDYKFFCFHGRVKIIQIDVGRFGDQRRNLYDRDFQPLDATLLYPSTDTPVPKPEQLDEAITIAEKLSSEVNFVRVDLYLVDGHIYFGELTNYPGNGFKGFEPESMDYRIGGWLDLDTRFKDNRNTDRRS